MDMQNLCAKRDKKIGTNYITTKYMSNNGSNYKSVFIPILLDNHWYVCVCDMMQKKNHILDSLPQRRSDKRTSNVVKVVTNVADIIARTNGYKHFASVKSFSYCNVSIPRQSDGFNCGVYVLKWLEAGEDHSLWTNVDYYKDMDAYRNHVLIKLLLWDKNKKVFS
ncbi:hypothetical protein RND81_01G096700 [Saponaria officinalis]|uniref:Ubiquitin-like protease family profile domain-containing protein n=1 Tax=Saponaria officinalis TaxID=3572 RepID=A0AAW1ND55_SAPOF